MLSLVVSNRAYILIVSLSQNLCQCELAKGPPRNNEWRYVPMMSRYSLSLAYGFAVISAMKKKNS